MSLARLPVGDTLVLSGNVRLNDEKADAAILPWRPASLPGDVAQVDIFSVVSSNSPPGSQAGTLQIHIALPAGGAAGTAQLRALAAVVVEHLPQQAGIAGKASIADFSMQRFTGINRIHASHRPLSPAPFRYVLACNTDPQAEAELNQWYDDEHLPGLAAVAGVHEARRDMNRYGEPRYRACYDLERANIVGNDDWLLVRNTPWSKKMQGFMQAIHRVLLERRMTLIPPSLKAE